MLLDPEVSRISSDAVKTVAKAAELMVQHLAAKAHGVAASNKRSTIKFLDVDRAARGDSRYVDMGLRDCFANDETFAVARGEGKQIATSAKAGKVSTVHKGRAINDFFTA